MTRLRLLYLGVLFPVYVAFAAKYGMDFFGASQPVTRWESLQFAGECTFVAAMTAVALRSCIMPKRGNG